jgi:hypothetical protein
MIRKPLQLALAASLLFATATLTSCQKQLNETATEDANTLTLEATEDDAEAEITFGDVGDQAMGADAEAGLGQIELFGGANTGVNSDDVVVLGNERPVDSAQGIHCFKITVVPKDPGVFPKTITIDYGTGCKGRDGKMRSGKIITVYSKPLVVPGAQAVTEFDNYFVDSVKVEGRHVIKNNSTSAVLVMSRLVQNGKLTRPNGSYVKWNAEHTTTQVAGLGTPFFPRDDEWSTTGGARGETFRRNTTTTWSRLIVEPLHKAPTCRWIDKGIVKVTRNDQTALLNFGNGTCDNKATIAKDGIIKEITLR